MKSLKGLVGGVLLVVAVCVCSAGAATYYVSSTGSSGNPGTEASPWSLAKANSTLVSGDTAILLNGSYSTAIAPTHNGNGQQSDYLSGAEFAPGDPDNV